MIDKYEDRPQVSGRLLCVFGGAGLLVSVILLIWSYGSFHKDRYGVVGLVEQVQGDLKKIEDESKDSQWKVQDVELEVNFVTKVGTNNKADLVAVSNDVATEHQDTHRLMLKLHRNQAGQVASVPEK